MITANANGRCRLQRAWEYNREIGILAFRFNSCFLGYISKSYFSLFSVFRVFILFVCYCLSVCLFVRWSSCRRLSHFVSLSICLSVSLPPSLSLCISGSLSITCTLTIACIRKIYAWRELTFITLIHFSVHSPPG